MPNCWKSHVAAHFLFCELQVDLRYASIQEEDISMYVVITGFVISNVSKCTVLPAKSDTDDMFCLQSYQGLIIDRSLVY